MQPGHVIPAAQNEAHDALIVGARLRCWSQREFTFDYITRHWGSGRHADVARAPQRYRHRAQRQAQRPTQQCEHAEEMRRVRDPKDLHGGGKQRLYPNNTCGIFLSRFNSGFLMPLPCSSLTPAA